MKYVIGTTSKFTEVYELDLMGKRISLDEDKAIIEVDDDDTSFDADEDITVLSHAAILDVMDSEDAADVWRPAVLTDVLVSAGEPVETEDGFVAIEGC